MSNEFYWKKTADLIYPGKEKERPSISEEELGSYAREYFQDGIVLMIMGNEERARFFLNKSRGLFEKKTDLYPEASDYMHIFTVKEMLGREEWNYYDKSLKLQLGDIGTKVMSYGIGDAADEYIRFINKTGILYIYPHKVDVFKAVEMVRESFPEKAFDVFPYKNLALMFLKLAIYLLGKNDTYNSTHAAESVKKFCKLAASRVIYTLGQEYPKWQDVIKNPGFYAELNLEEKAEFNEIRETVTSGIPQLVQQANIVIIMAARIRYDLDTLKKYDEMLFGKPEKKERKKKPSSLSSDPLGSIFPFLKSENSFENMVETFITQNIQNALAADTSPEARNFRTRSELKKAKAQGGLIGSIVSAIYPPFLDRLEDYVDKFYEEHVYPPGRRQADTTLPEDVAWIRIRRIYEPEKDEFDITKPVSYYVKKYLR